MAQAVVNPDDLRRFAHTLKQFNNELQNRMMVLHGQLTALGDTWRDKEHEKFSQEFDQTLLVVKRFVESANLHIPFLIRKAERVEEYLQQRQDQVMSTGTARVLSIESLVRFRAKLCEFGDDVKDTLSAIEMQLHRAFDWLDERAKHWLKEIKVRQEEVVRAKIDLESRKMMCKDGRGPGTTDQEKALRKAQARLKEAEEKSAACKRWHPLLQHAVHEYHGPARLLGSTMDMELKHTLNLLAQKIAALEAYLAVAPPPTVQPVGNSADAALPGMGFGESTQTTTPGGPESKTPEVALPQEAAVGQSPSSATTA